MQRKKESGVITIYLALVLTIILAFIVTTIEVARVETSKTYIARVLQTSLESSLCDYYLPLFEEYHLFGLDLQGGTRDEQESRLIGTIQERMNDSLLPEKDADPLSLIWNGSMASFLMCNPKISKLSIENCIFLSDDAGVYAKNQMLAYSKYQAPMELIEKMMDAMGLMEETEKASDVLQDKMELEQKMAEIDEHALRIVEYVEGIDTNEYGIEFSTFSKELTHRSDFAKQIVNTEPTMQSLLISNSDIFEELKDEYYNFLPVITHLLEQGESVMNQTKEYERKYAKYIEDVKAFEQADYLEEVKQEKKEELEEREEEINAEYHLLQVQASECANLSSDLLKAINIVVSQVQNMNRAAIIEISQIKNTKSNLEGDYTEYLSKLAKREEEFSKEFFSNLQEEAKSAKKYADTSEGNVSVIMDIHQMEQTLTNNVEIMNQILLNQTFIFSTSEDGYAIWKAKIEKLEQQLLSLSNKGLQFDYSNLDTKQEDRSAFYFITELFDTSLVDLVAGDLEVSKETIDKNNLVSNHLTDSDNIQVDKDQMEISNIMSGGLTLGDRGFDTDSALGDLAKNLLLVSYVDNHMINFTSEQQKEDYGLHYEQEYILSGKYEDEENLNQVVLYLLLFRLLMNCASIMTDTEKGKKAEATAAAVVGWIPIAGLTYVFKYLILIYWAYCEAVIEVSALLHGKSVPIYTTKSDFVVAYSDIFFVSDTYVEEKASSYESKNQLTLNYSQYLFLFHLFVSDQDTVARTLDIIQENIEYEYDDNFLIRNCLISYSCNVESEMESKFFFLPYFQKNQISLGNYQIQGKAAVTY